jgi:hypothetical protein
MELGWTYQEYLQMTEQELYFWYDEYIRVKKEQSDYLDGLKG